MKGILAYLLLTIFACAAPKTAESPYPVSYEVPGLSWTDPLFGPARSSHTMRVVRAMSLQGYIDLRVAYEEKCYADSFPSYPPGQYHLKFDTIRGRVDLLGWAETLDTSWFHSAPTFHRFTEFLKRRK